MLGLGWGEMLVLATVAILVVGPKDLPKMLRSIGRTVKSVRSVAGDFQRQFSDAIDEIDDDGTMRAAANPMKSVKGEIDAVKEDFDLGWMDDEGPRRSAEAAVKKRMALDEAMSAEASKAAAKPTGAKPSTAKSSTKKQSAKKPS
ncbi:MAG: Sec-independent protein translocase protein TatB, partial [Pseudomonadota bacterium]